MSGKQEGDVLFSHMPGVGGEITAIAGLISMSGGLETSAYLSLFGGNIEDDGRADSKNSWWGNFGESDPQKHYISLTQNLLKSIPSTSANLRRVEDAVLTDLQWMVDVGVASAVSAEARITGINEIQIDISIDADEKVSAFTFLQNWQVNTL